MSDRNKPHNGRDLSGHSRPYREDVDDVQADPVGADIIRGEVRQGGAVEDVGIAAGQRGAHIHELVEENRENVKKLAQS